ncbi:MAG: type II secretion system protein [bacterium]|nr:type II secretion system protein [bacterium]
MKKVRDCGFTLYHFSDTRSGKGFTLIELLVVIAIIGVLSSVVLASLNTARQKGRDTRRISDIKQLQLALELYYDANSKYPTQTDFFGEGPESLKGAGYISVIPSDPGSAVVCTAAGTEASCYTYAALGATTCTSYHLGGSLEVLGNSALSSDNDATAGTTCTGGGTDFVGLANGACETSLGSIATDLCYDVKP